MKVGHFPKKVNYRQTTTFSKKSLVKLKQMKIYSMLQNLHLTLHIFEMSHNKWGHYLPTGIGWCQTQ